MANPPRSRKRVFADLRRAADGSAFQKCACCGVSVAVALADMHVCGEKIKKPKPQFQQTQIGQAQKLEQPRSVDGSAFQKCASCGVSVAVALANKHVCEVKIKKPKPTFQEPQICQTDKVEQPRSAYLFFMESFAKTCENENIVDIDKRARLTWKNMSQEDKLPYILEETRVDKAYVKALLEESSGIIQADDEADSRRLFHQRRK